MYKGVLHQTGMRWSDGCAYTCICSDGKTGQYRCSPKYESIYDMGLIVTKPFFSVSDQVILQQA